MHVEITLRYTFGYGRWWVGIHPRAGTPMFAVGAGKTAWSAIAEAMHTLFGDAAH